MLLLFLCPKLFKVCGFSKLQLNLAIAASASTKCSLGDFISLFISVVFKGIPCKCYIYLSAFKTFLFFHLSCSFGVFYLLPSLDSSWLSVVVHVPSSFSMNSLICLLYGVWAKICFLIPSPVFGFGIWVYWRSPEGMFSGIYSLI